MLLDSGFAQLRTLRPGACTRQCSPEITLNRKQWREMAQKKSILEGMEFSSATMRGEILLSFAHSLLGCSATTHSRSLVVVVLLMTQREEDWRNPVLQSVAKYSTDDPCVTFMDVKFVSSLKYNHFLIIYLCIFQPRKERIKISKLFCRNEKL